MIVLCPICKKTVPWTEESAYRPFCSERCKNHDLSAWAMEQYRVDGGEKQDDDEIDSEEFLDETSQSCDEC